MRPTSQPTLQPTGRPTSSKPSSRPSGAPTKFPITLVPTKTQDHVIIPKRQPTSMPSYDLNYKTSSFYYDYKSLASTIANQSNTYSYISFNFKTVPVSGSCSGWNSFIHNKLSAPFNNFEYTHLNATFITFDYKSHISSQMNTTCNTLTSVLQLVSALRSGTTLDVNCNGNLWRVFQCSQNSILCINCKRSCAPSVLCPGKSYSFGTCVSGCDGRVTATTLLTAVYAVNRYYPLLNTFNATANQTSVEISATLSSPGLLYCGAFKSPFVLQSLNQIAQSGFSSVAPYPGEALSIVILDLEPSTVYNIYCYTSDYLGHIMSLVDATTTLTSIETLCCKSVVILSKVSAFIQSSSVSSSTVVQNFPQFYFGLNARPSSDVTMGFYIQRIACPGAVLLSGSIDVSIYPSTYKFHPTDPSLSAGFLVQGSTVGCFALRAYITTSIELYASANLTFIIQNSKTALPPPNLESASLTNDGLYLNIYFSAPTNIGTIQDTNSSVFGSSALNCSSIVKFPGAASAVCYWASAAQLVAYAPGYKNGRPYPSIGDTVQLLANTIKAQCSQFSVSGCSNYQFAPSQSVIITPPLNPLKPVVLLLGPTAISTCDNLVIDPTASTGNAGRGWSFMKWNVSGSSSTSQIVSYLNSKIKDTSSIVTIPIGLFSPGFQYTITLTLVNVFQQESTGSISFTVSNAGTALPAPLLRLYTPSKVFYRSQQIDIFASVSFSSCSGSSGNSSLLYQWKFYQGANYLQNIQSSSLDPRFFSVSPYTLSALTSYTVSVAVSIYAAGFPTHILSTSVAAVNFAIGSSGLVAQISGGNYRSVSSGDLIQLNAAASYDADYPSGNAGDPLLFRWSCMVIAPSYGGNCNLPSSGLLTNAAISVDSSKLSVQQYNFSVTVYTASGKRAKDSVVVNVISPATPLVNIFTGSSVAKYNTQDNIVLLGNITSSHQQSAAQWSSPDLPTAILSNMALTPLSQIVPMGVYIFQLALSLRSLQPGSTYNFKLQSNYLGSTSSGSAVFSVIVNRPPSGGFLSISPSVGLAMNTQFYLSTADWVDDGSDLPFTYQFSYYVLTPSNENIIKAFNLVPFTYSTLGQGLTSQNNLVTCVVVVSDAFSGQSTTTTTATVTSNIFSSSLVQQANKAMSIAFSTGNRDGISQVVNAALGSANSVSCVVPLTCSSLNRQSCLYTANTCGPCLPGYVGIPGDSNVACGLLQNLNSTGQFCMKNTDCASGVCRLNTCADTLKKCPNNCNGKGSCLFEDDVGNPMQSCNITNPFCSASCVCQSGYFGSDCSLSSSTFQQENYLKSSLCANIYKIVKLQSTTEDIIQQRAVMIANIFVDPSQISNSALDNCTAALLETVYSNPSDCCQGNNQYQLTNAFSKILQLGSRIPKQLAANISSSLSFLSGTCLQQSAVGQLPTVIQTDNIRLIQFKASRSSSNKVQCVSTQTNFESALNIPATTFCQNLSALASPTQVLGVSIQVYTNNPFVRSSSSSSITIASFSSAASTTAHSRYLVSEANAVRTTFTFQNKQPIDYITINQTQLVIKCLTNSQHSYVRSGICPNGLPYNVTCPGNERGFFEINCAGYVTIPQCTIWNGYNYVPFGACSVEKYDSLSTSCTCLQPPASRVQTLSASYAVVYAYQTEIYHLYAIPTTNSIGNIVVSTVSCVAGLLLVGFFFFAIYSSISSEEKKNQKRLTELKYLENKNARTVKGFFEELIPAELGLKKWYHILGRRLLVEHSLCRVLMNMWKVDIYDGFPVPWVILMGRMLIVFSIETVMSMYFNADDGFCEGLKDEQSCNGYPSTLAAFSIPYRHCAWNSRSYACQFDALSTGSFYVIILWTFSVLFFATPFFRVLDVLVSWSRIFFSQSESSKVVPFYDSGNFSDEFLSFQRFKSTMLRAAGLVLSQRMIDFVSIDEEVEHIIQLGNEDSERLRLNSVQRDYQDTTSFSKIRHGFNSSSLSKRTVTKRVAFSKDSAKKLAIKVEEQVGNESKEAYLMKVFIIESFSGTSRKLLRKFLLPPSWKPSVGVPLISAIAVVIWLAGMTYFILRFGLSIGSQSSTLWLITGLVCIGEDNFLLQPLKLALHWIAATSSFQSDLNFIVERLLQRSKIILMRTGGVLRAYKWIVQHMNPACRVARLNPICALPVARLIMAINDFDLPLQTAGSVNFWIGILPRSVIEAVFLFPFALLPAFLDDIFLDLYAALIINALATAFYLMAYYLGSYLYPSIVVAGFIVVLIVAELFRGRIPSVAPQKPKKAKAKEQPKDLTDFKYFDSIDEIDNDAFQEEDDEWQDIAPIALSQLSARRSQADQRRSIDLQESSALVNLEEKESGDEKEIQQKVQSIPGNNVKATEIVTRTGGDLEEDSIMSEQMSSSNRLKPYVLPAASRFSKPYQPPKEQLKTTYSLLELIPRSVSADDVSSDRSQKYRVGSAPTFRRTSGFEVAMEPSRLMDDVILSTPGKPSAQISPDRNSPDSLLDISAALGGSTFSEAGAKFERVQPQPTSNKRPNSAAYYDGEISLSVDNVIIDHPGQGLGTDGSVDIRSATTAGKSDEAPSYDAALTAPDEGDSVVSNAERHRSPYQMMSKRQKKKARGGGADDERSRHSRKGRPHQHHNDADRSVTSARSAVGGDGDGSVSKSISSYRRNRHRRSASRSKVNESEPETGMMSARKDGPGRQEQQLDKEEGGVERERQALARKMTLVDQDETPAEPIVAPPFLREDSLRSLDSITPSQASSRVGPGSKLYRIDQY